MKIRYILSIFILIGFYSCNIAFKLVDSNELESLNLGEDKINNGEAVSAVEEIRLKAYYAAEAYLISEMEYELGGDDDIYIKPYTRGIDCSGLVINCYEFAVEDTEYSIPFLDKTADEIYKYYSIDITSPEEGDLIIWTDNNGEAYHIALFEKTENDRYYFIESNEYVNQYETVDGMNYRSLSVDSVYNITIKRFILTDNS